MKLQKIVGITLLEVLVSLAILSVAVLALSTMQAVIINSNRAAYFFILAANQMQNLNDRLHLVHSDSEAEQEVLAWNKENRHILPFGKGMLIGHYPYYQITLTWGKGKQYECVRDRIGESGCISSKAIAG